MQHRTAVGEETDVTDVCFCSLVRRSDEISYFVRGYFTTCTGELHPQTVSNALLRYSMIYTGGAFIAFFAFLEPSIWRTSGGNLLLEFSGLR